MALDVVFSKQPVRNR